MSLRNPWHRAGAGLLQELQQSSQLNGHKCLCMDLYLTLTPAALLLLNLLTVAFLNSMRLSCVAVYSQNQFVQLAKMSYGGPYICPSPPSFTNYGRKPQGMSAGAQKFAVLVWFWGPRNSKLTMKIYRNITVTITSHCWRTHQEALFCFSAYDQKRLGKSNFNRNTRHTLNRGDF